MSKSIESNKQFMIGNGLLAFGVFFIVCLFLYLGFRSQKKVAIEQTYKDIYEVCLTKSFDGDSLNIFINDSLIMARTMSNADITFQVNRFADENVLMVVDAKTDIMTPFNLSKEGGKVTVEKKNGQIFFLYEGNEHLKMTFASIIGMVIAGFVLLIIGISVIGGMVATTEVATVVKENSVFVLDLKGSVVERYEDNPFEQLLGEEITTRGLEDILASIEKAKNDPKIKGMLINAEAFACSTASLQDIRTAIANFKESGKFVVAYSGAYTQGAYYVSTVADKVFLNPSGSISWHGLSAQTMFLKDLLAKVGVKMQIFRVGTYKSAVEPFIATEMSPANREQTLAFTQSIWNEIVSEVSESRNISVEKLNEMADKCMDFQPAEAYVENGLADQLMYKDEVLSYLKKLTNISEKSTLNTLTLDDMKNLAVPSTAKSRDVIAVYYAFGEIDNAADPYNEGIVSEKVTKHLRDLRNDDNVKAVVLRVNSPGGSAYGSEQIWREVSLLKEKKPVVVSMGDYAASGGYYISCAADWIVAQPTTLTGSIGIFGMIPDASELITKKLGVKIDGVKTNKLADMGDMSRPFNAEEGALIQGMVNSGYELFTKRCAEGRNMPIDSLKMIAEGRVWSGEMAKELKLVDELGNLECSSATLNLRDISAANWKTLSENSTTDS